MDQSINTSSPPTHWSLAPRSKHLMAISAHPSLDHQQTDEFAGSQSSLLLPVDVVAARQNLDLIRQVSLLFDDGWLLDGSTLDIGWTGTCAQG